MADHSGKMVTMNLGQQNDGARRVLRPAWGALSKAAASVPGRIRSAIERVEKEIAQLRQRAGLDPVPQT